MDLGTWRLLLTLVRAERAMYFVLYPEMCLIEENKKYLGKILKLIRNS